MFAFLFPPLSLCVSNDLPFLALHLPLDEALCRSRFCVKIIRNLLPREFEDPLAPFPVIIALTGNNSNSNSRRGHLSVLLLLLHFVHLDAS